MGTSIKLPDRYKTMIKHASEKILRESAKIFAEDYRNKYRSVILDFYKDYPKPHSYNRTLETQNANIIRENNYDYKKTFRFVNPEHTAIEFKFRIGPHYEKRGCYRADNEYVFFRTYFMGIHGWTPEEVDNYVGNNYAYYGKDGKYYINHMLYWYDVPKPMNPPPAVLMNDFHKSYKMPGHLREIMQPLSRKIMDELLS